MVQVDASDLVVGGELSQPDAHGVWKPVAFFSTKMDPAECNYEIYDKELLAIIRAFEEWRPELEGAEDPVSVVTDHKNLVHFMTAKQLSRRQARWSEFLSRFNFNITYRPGPLNGKADALTRRSGDLPPKGGDKRTRHQFQTILKPHNLSESVRNDPEISTLRLQPADVWQDAEDLDEESDDIIDLADPNEAPILDQLLAAYREDDFAKLLIENLQNGVRRMRDFPLSESTLEPEGPMVRFRDRLFVPATGGLRLRLIQMAHDSPVTGHPGAEKCHEIISRNYWWPHIGQEIRKFCRNCHGCLRSKINRDRYHGALKPLPPPERRWRHISMDFIVELPEALDCYGRRVKNIMVVVDRLTKMTHFIPCDAMDPTEAARLFFHHVFKLHGLPDSIVSDRGSQFVSHFWKRLSARLKIVPGLSTAYHPETDGQTERMNAELEQYLRIYCNWHQDDWPDWLPSAEFSINNHVSATTRVTPFFANTGFHPRLGFEPALPVPENLDSRGLESAADADNFALRMEQIDNYCHDTIGLAQESQQEFANRRRQNAPAYQEGDRVYVSARNMNQGRPSRKLSDQWLGPYEIIKRVSSHAYRLRLRPQDKVHPTFHTSLLRPAPSDPLPGQITEPPPPLAPLRMDGEPDPDARPEELQWEVARVEDSKREKDHLKFLVRWVGYPDVTWEPEEYLANAPLKVADFFRRYPLKSGNPGYRTPAGSREASPESDDSFEDLPADDSDYVED